ncbi:fumarylacetoacetate hydrolase family protein [Nocardia sp. CA-290969]|uniref:fumarylacetoacetate hydrolase family protein n=1 Tax=Nocardia sp. CA-290969 TaxID=3239986 RepID=UPI003D942BE2
MRFAQIYTARGLRTHLRTAAGGYIDLGDAADDESLASLNGLIDGYPSLADRLGELRERAGSDIDESEFGPAAPNPGRILCVGRNYREHALEVGDIASAADIPDWPETFVRGADSVAGPYAELVRPAFTSCLDFEGELGVVIGRDCRYVRAADALEAVFGYTVLNDVTARDWQRAGLQWTPGKNFDASMPIGPEIVTADEVDVTDLRLTTTVNGVEMQSANTAQMMVGVAETIEFFSSFTTLRRGDVIATGTPGGVGFARKPPLYLGPGDRVEVAIEGIGAIRNLVVAEQGAPVDWPWIPLVREAHPAP